MSAPRIAPLWIDCTGCAPLGRLPTLRRLLAKRQNPRFAGVSPRAAEGARTLDLLHGKCLNPLRMVTAGRPFSCYQPLFAHLLLHSR